MANYNQNHPVFPPELITRSSLVCGGKKQGSYNLPLHVAALFIILIQSILSCAFPLLVKRFPQLRVPHHFLFLSKHFGTGVLIATAFIHLLPTAFRSLTDPCLPAFWNEGYPAMAGLIAMISVFLVVVVEMFFSIMNGGSMGGCHGGHGYESLENAASPSLGRQRTSSNASETGLADFTSRGGISRPIHRRSGSIGRQLQQIELSEGQEGAIGVSSDSLAGGHDAGVYPRSDDSDSEEDSAIELRTLNPPPKRPIRSPRSSREGMTSGNGSILTEEQQQKKNMLQLLLLEAGILFHSVFIGMALSVATGSNFMVLLVAITFHQTFEGLALGSRIAGTTFPKHSLKPWLMCLAYGTTTPIGQAIGLVTRNLYDPASQTGLLMVGITNAISSGLLLFAGLVELLAEDFLSDESYVDLTGKRRLQACLAVALGSAGMAFVGAWA